MLEYQDWRNFVQVIDKARLACEKSGQWVNYHFGDVTRMVDIGFGFGFGASASAWWWTSLCSASEGSWALKEARQNCQIQLADIERLPARLLAHAFGSPAKTR